jgi:hypothetical protein
MRSLRSCRLQALFPLIVSAAACGGATSAGDPPGRTSSGGATNPPSNTPNETTNPNPTNATTPGNAFDLPLRCITDGRPHWEAATPSVDIDGFEIRRIENETSTIIATPKALCTKALDAAACAQAIAAVSGDGWDPHAGQDFGPRVLQRDLAVTTAGDQVNVLRTVDELTAALSPVDSPDEALILAHLRGGWRPVCTADPVLAARASGDAWELFVQKGGQCGAALIEATIIVARDGTVAVISQKELKPAGPNPCGRRPDGLEPMANGAGDGVGGLLARMAWLEAASVPAFAALASDLGRHGAPAELVARALEARSDEIMHARLTREAARRFGAAIERPRIARATPRSLFELALENAVEGCVREAFGALVATHQAEHAGDERLRSMFAAIAKDETEHAALSFDIAEWIEPLLSDTERAEVERARGQAFAELEESLRSEPSSEEIALGGMPAQRTARRLLEALRGLDSKALSS